MSKSNRKSTASAKHRRPAASAKHRQPAATAKEVAKIAVTGAGFQRADHAGSGGRCAGARAGYPLSALPVKAQHIVRAGVLAFVLGVGAVVANTPAVAFAAPDDTSSSASRRRRPVRHQNPRQVRHQRIRLHQQLRRPQRLIRRQVRRLRRCRVRLTPKPVRPPHHVTLRRQTHALGLCRVRVARTPALPRRAATPPHQLRRRPPKPGRPLPTPQRRRPRRRPPSSRPQRHPPSNPTSGSPTEEPAAPAPSAKPVQSLVAQEEATPDAPQGDSHTAPNSAGSALTNRSGSVSATSANPAVNGGRQGRRNLRVDR